MLGGRLGKVADNLDFALKWLDASGVNMVPQKLQMLSSEDRLNGVDDDAVVL